MEEEVKKRVENLKKMLVTCREPIFCSSQLKVWESPDPWSVYYIAADISTGFKNKDFSCAQVLRWGGEYPKETKVQDVQVAEWHGNGDFRFVSESLFLLGMRYNKAGLAIEVNGLGSQVNDLLRDMGYPNLFKWKRLDRWSRMSEYCGWTTNVKTRDLIINTFQQAVKDQSIIIHNKALVGEALDWVSESGIGSDDRLMAFMICLFCLHDSLPLKSVVA